MKLFGVGFFASLLGVGITNTLVTARQMLDPAFVPLNPPQVLKRGASASLRRVCERVLVSAVVQRAAVIGG